jgi:hypothetical protein
MSLKIIKNIYFLLIFLVLGSAAIAKPKGKAAKTIPLSKSGKMIEANYNNQLKTLKAEITAALPKINAEKKSSYIKALNSEKSAKLKLESSKKNLGQVKAAEALVGHAKGKWIGGADKGIAKAKDKLKKAKNATDRKEAEKELAKWQKNRQDGVSALKERQAKLDKAKIDVAKYKKEYAEATKSLASAKAKIAETLISFKLDTFLQKDNLDPKLLKFVIINEATANGLAAFTQQGAQHKKLIDSLLSNTALMKQMLFANGAKEGKYGKAMQIYSAIQKVSKQAKEGIFQRLALAISLEHAVPIAQRNPVANTKASQTIDPVKRYQHYEKSYLNNELDPAFKFLSTWDLRMVVDGYEPDKILTWGREMLRNYRPDQISTKDYRWRYVAAVKTDIRYGSQDNKYDKPELQFFQNILSNGGICGRRAFYGRFMLRAFGIPTAARPQKGHAALVHWTPKGWVICLGAGWGSGFAPRPYNDLDFLAITQGRQNPKAFLSVKRAAWFGDVAGEQRMYGLTSTKNTPTFWNSLSLNLQSNISEQSGAKALAAVGSDIAEANESRVKEKVKKVNISSDDKRIVVSSNGVINIPAAACSKPSNSTGKIKFMKSYLGGMQLHYERNGRAQDFEYTFDSPASGKYQLVARVVTPSWKQHFLVSLNGSSKPIDFALPYTVGKWETTKPIIIQLNKGKNIMKFSRGAEIDGEGKRNKGVTFKDFTLVPVK